ncbi:MAG: ferredoxin family protein [Pseudomonadota bacterium]
MPTATSSEINIIECKQAPGTFTPIINRNRCEGKADCIPACPYDVFVMDTLTAEERQQLSLIGKLKAWAHGGKQARAINADQCRACGECVSVCPEKAITLQRAG